MYCKNCGTKNKDAAVFCTCCRQPLGGKVVENRVEGKKNTKLKGTLVGSHKEDLAQNSESVYNFTKKEIRKPIKKKRKRKTARVIAFAGILLAVCGGIAGVFIFRQMRNQQLPVDKDIQYVSENLYFYPMLEENIVYDQDTHMQIMKNELLADAVPGTDENEIKEFIEDHSGIVAGFIRETGSYQILFKDLTCEELHQMKEVFVDSGLFQYVGLNMVMAMDEMYFPNDELWKDDWGDENAKGLNWAVEAIDAPGAWDYKDQMEKVRVGIFDGNGFYTEHEDLKNRFAGVLGHDRDDHGTAVSGIIGAGFDNGIGISGMVPYVDMYGAAWRCAKTADSVREASENKNLATAMTYRTGLSYLILMNDCKVVNMSIGFGNFMFSATNGTGACRENAIKFLEEVNESLESFLKLCLWSGHEFVICCAAGNESSGAVAFFRQDDGAVHLDYRNCKKEIIAEYGKAAYNNPDRIETGDNDARYSVLTGIKDEEIAARILCVGAVEMTDKGRFQVSDYSNGGERVDVIAPGGAAGEIKIRCLSWNEENSDDDAFYKECYGTSLSAPYVSGTAALLLSVNPALRGDEVKEIIVSAAVGNYKCERSYGTSYYPMLNAKNAVAEALRRKDQKEAVQKDAESIHEGNSTEKIFSDYVKEVLVPEYGVVNSAQRSGDCAWPDFVLAMEDFVGDEKEVVKAAFKRADFVLIPEGILNIFCLDFDGDGKQELHILRNEVHLSDAAECCHIVYWEIYEIENDEIVQKDSRIILSEVAAPEDILYNCYLKQQENGFCLYVEADGNTMDVSEREERVVYTYEQGKTKVAVSLYSEGSEIGTLSLFVSFSEYLNDLSMTEYYSYGNYGVDLDFSVVHENIQLLDNDNMEVYKASVCEYLVPYGITVESSTDQAFSGMKLYAVPDNTYKYLFGYEMNVTESDLLNEGYCSYEDRIETGFEKGQYSGNGGLTGQK